MQEQPRYKLTIFDKYGPDAGDLVRATIFAALVFAITLVWLLFARGLSMSSVIYSALAALGSFAFMLSLSVGAGGTYKHLMMSGASTPAVDQFSYQDALVMQRRIDDALASYETVIRDDPSQVTARIRAAELYLREDRSVERALELLKEAQQVPAISAGEDVYVTNRVADLLAGPLHKPGAALGELRRLIDRHPTLPAADHAREAIARIKATLLPADEISG